jgi:aminoglycoside 6'-N-acetyltransferase I
MRIVDLVPEDTQHVAALADVLFASFAELSPAYLPTVEAARAAINETFGDDRCSRLLLTDSQEIGGWIAGVHAYGRLWEMHPLVVSPAYRRRGFGQALVKDLARLVAARGALTLYASTSDESNRTNLFGQDLYSDPLGALERLRAIGDHPMNFYINVGFSLVGVMPDAEGRGMPSIHFAMSVG